MDKKLSWAMTLLIVALVPFSTGCRWKDRRIACAKAVEMRDSANRLMDEIKSGRRGFGFNCSALTDAAEVVSGPDAQNFLLTKGQKFFCERKDRSYCGKFVSVKTAAVGRTKSRRLPKGDSLQDIVLDLCTAQNDGGRLGGASEDAVRPNYLANQTVEKAANKLEARLPILVAAAPSLARKACEFDPSRAALDEMSVKGGNAGGGYDGGYDDGYGGGYAAPSDGCTQWSATGDCIANTGVGQIGFNGCTPSQYCNSRPGFVPSVGDPSQGQGSAGSATVSAPAQAQDPIGEGQWNEGNYNGAPCKGSNCLPQQQGIPEGNVGIELPIGGAPSDAPPEFTPPPAPGASGSGQQAGTVVAPAGSATTQRFVTTQSATRQEAGVLVTPVITDVTDTTTITVDRTTNKRNGQPYYVSGGQSGVGGGGVNGCIPSGRVLCQLKPLCKSHSCR